MKGEALDSLASEANKFSTPEAAPMPSKTKAAEQGTSDMLNHKSSENLGAPSQSDADRSATPFGQRTDGTESVAKLVEEVVYGVKVAVDGALAWAEKKADDLSSEQDNIGPYASPATRVPSDFDPIPTSVLPTTSNQESSAQKDGEDKENEDQGRNDSVTGPSS